MKIRRKLLLSYLIITALVIAAGATITYNSMKMADLQSNAKQQEDINNNAYAYQQGLDQKQFGTLMYSADQVQEGTKVVVAGADLQVPAQTFLENALIPTPTLLTQFSQVAEIDNNQINTGIRDVAQLYSDASLNSTEKYPLMWDKLSQIMNATAQADTQLAALRTSTQANVQAAVTESQNYANFSIIMAVGFISALVVASVVMSVVIGNRITVPLKNLSAIAQKVTQGDLDQRYYLKENIDLKKADEVDELTDSFKKMINAFRMQEALLKEDEGKDNRDA